MKFFNIILLNSLFVLIIGCGGGGEATNPPEQIPSAPTVQPPAPDIKK